jgi:DNA-binding response OmpR family regulator
MSFPEKRCRTILNFGTNREVLLARARSLSELGYRVINANDGFEAIRLAADEVVDAVVLDLDRDDAEIALVASEIKHCRPRVPGVVLTEGTGLTVRAHQLADVLVSKRDDIGMLIDTLEDLLSGARRINTPEGVS